VIAFRDTLAPALQMGEHHVAAAADVDGHVIAGGVVRVGFCRWLRNRG
jgi:hypothetical protein